jgi:hypothetical protein
MIAASSSGRLHCRQVHGHRQKSIRSRDRLGDRHTPPTRDVEHNHGVYPLESGLEDVIGTKIAAPNPRRLLRQLDLQASPLVDRHGLKGDGPD